MEVINHKEKLDYYLDLYNLREVIKPQFIPYLNLYKYKKGETILQMDDEFNYFYFLVEGKLLVHLSTEEGREMFLDFCTPLDLLGDLEYVTKKSTWNNVEAIRTSYLIAIPREILDKNAKDNINFYKMLTEFLGDKMGKNMKRYTNMILYPLKDRIASYLYEICGDSNEMILLKQGELALSFGISDRHLRRVLADMEEEGILTKSRNKIEIKDLTKLKTYVIK